MAPALEEKPWPTLGFAVAAWIEEHLVFGPGDLRGLPMKLDDEKKALLARMYEVYPHDHPNAGRRRFRRCALSLQKGSAKTELAALIAAAELHPGAPVRCYGFDKRGNPKGRGVTDPYIPMVAYTEEQSDELAYSALLVILELSKVAGDFDFGLERILRRPGGDGKAVSLASAPDARDGARTTFQVFDEPLALYTPVPTPAGWRTIGEIEPGDEVYDRNGHVSRVIGVSPIHEGRPCCRVVFNNGDSVVVDDAHRWTVTDWSNRPAGEHVRTTGELLKRGLATFYGFRWRLPRASGFDGVHSDDLPIEPYLLGLWLGDGSTNAGYINSPTPDYPELAAGIEHSVSHDARHGVTRWLPAGLRQKLRIAGLLGRKHIPDPYCFADREQRLSLLQGLMDTDGHTTPRGNCTFVQKDRALCEQVAILVRSLGCNATVGEQAEPRSRTGVMCKTHFSPAFCPFRTRRQAEKATWWPRRSTHWPAIVAIVPVETTPVRCLAVDSEDNLFLVGRGLHLTHNTHRFTMPRLRAAHKTMLANLPKRRIADPWALEITTAFSPGERSIAEDTMNYALSVLAGQREDSRLFFFHRQASDGCDLTTPEGVRAAVIEAAGATADWKTPDGQAGRDIDGICEQWQDPTSDLTYLERMYLNRPSKSSDKAFDVEQWKRLAQLAPGPGYTIPEGALITLGFDGSRSHDGTALVATEVATGFQQLVGLWEPALSVAAGRVDESWEVPEADVDAAVTEAFRRWNVWRLYADPFWWEGWVAQWQGRYGDKRVIAWRTNRVLQMAAAIRSYTNAMAAGEISHDGNAGFARHIGNACRQETNYRDERGQALYLIRKERPDSSHKMDAAMAGCLSHEARNDAIAAGALEKKTMGVSMYVAGDKEKATP